ncbi:MAG: hypothetical protein ABI969_17155 [bacterium]
MNVAGLLLVAVSAPTAIAAQTATPRDCTLPTVFHIGDSTVRNGSGTGSNGQWGWGDRTSCYFDTTKANIVNRALGGRSSGMYLTGGAFEWFTVALVW